ncbi:MAG TPA: 30S ribosomal protein S16 [Candidatus Eisenbacteria bacterium]|jgi:small subunit ribosomal protein S16|nr:30S ribosomal protein S16 [Candidatus Eisenbacteria bacterium]
MSVVIRMRRTGAKGRPAYRVVVADSRYPRDGRYIEQLGYYDPLTDPATFQINAERLSMWIQRGALPSESVGVMVAKHAPDALRKPLQPATPAPELAEVPKPKKKVAKKAAAKKKTVKPAAKATKGGEKKAKTRAKAKARKASGVAKPRATKKAKKKKS